MGHGMRNDSMVIQKCVLKSRQYKAQFYHRLLCIIFKKNLFHFPYFYWRLQSCI